MDGDRVVIATGGLPGTETTVFVMVRVELRSCAAAGVGLVAAAGGAVARIAGVAATSVAVVVAVVAAAVVAVAVVVTGFALLPAASAPRGVVGEAVAIVTTGGIRYAQSHDLVRTHRPGIVHTACILTGPPIFSPGWTVIAGSTTYTTTRGSVCT